MLFIQQVKDLVPIDCINSYDFTSNLFRTSQKKSVIFCLETLNITTVGLALVIMVFYLAYTVVY